VSVVDDRAVGVEEIANVYDAEHVQADRADGAANETAAAAEARNPASVIPIWIVARNRFGSRTSLATTRPAPDRWARRRSWPSRKLINSISLPDKAPFSRTRTTTSAS
jgi:hypothetical protein